MICKILKNHVLFIQIELPTTLFSFLNIFENTKCLAHVTKNPEKNAKNTESVKKHTFLTVIEQNALIGLVEKSQNH